MAGYIYERGHGAHHIAAGEVILPDQVADHMALWDRADMPFPALDAAGRTVVIRLSDTDA